MTAALLQNINPRKYEERGDISKLVAKHSMVFSSSLYCGIFESNTSDLYVHCNRQRLSIQILKSRQKAGIRKDVQAGLCASRSKPDQLYQNPIGKIYMTEVKLPYTYEVKCACSQIGGGIFHGEQKFSEKSTECPHGVQSGERGLKMVVRGPDLRSSIQHISERLFKLYAS
jgi:hypothetical protein